MNTLAPRYRFVLSFPRTSGEAFKDAEYASSVYVFRRAPWYVRLARNVREILS